MSKNNRLQTAGNRESTPRGGPPDESTAVEKTSTDVPIRYLRPVRKQIRFPGTQSAYTTYYII